MVGASMAVPAVYFLVLSIIGGLIAGFLELEVRLSSLSIKSIKYRRHRRDLNSHILASLAYLISIISLLIATGVIVPV